MNIVLAIMTILGGITALWFLWDKFFGTANLKEVNSSWWETSALKEKLEKKGYSFRWSNSDAVAERISNGYERVYLREKLRKYILTNKSGQILLGKRRK